MSPETKTALYNRVMSTRNELKEDAVISASADIQKKVILMEEFRTALRFGLYAPYRNEARTDTVFIVGDRHRKEIYYPALDPVLKKFAYFRVTALEDLLPFGDGRPAPSGKQSRLRDINTLDCLICPGVAFDLKGGRMGFGEGFFDETLLAFRGRRIALAYEFQVVSELPHAISGRKVDWIVTEKRIVKCG